MKKIIILALALIMCLSLVACGSKETKETKGETQEVVAPADTEKASDTEKAADTAAETEKAIRTVAAMSGTEYEKKLDDGKYSIVETPKFLLDESVEGYDAVQEINKKFTDVTDPIIESIENGTAEGRIIYGYSYFEYDGVFGIRMYKTTDAGSGDDTFFYFDGNAKKEITEDEYLEKVGYSKDDALKLLKEDESLGASEKEIVITAVLRKPDQVYVLAAVDGERTEKSYTIWKTQ